MISHRIDKFFLGITLGLVAFGLAVFLSASFGILARSPDKFTNIQVSQLVEGFGGGLLALFYFARFPYKIWKKYAYAVFLLALIVSALVFVPGIGMAHGGAKRWISLGPISFQPAEFLKFGFVIYLAAWLTMFRKKVMVPHFGLYPFAVLSLIAGAILLSQPDTGTFLILISAGTAMYIVGGAKWSHIGAIFIGGILAVALMAYFKPYVLDRITTLINPSPSDLQGSGYQIKQSLIAIGSGEMTGRGYGQSIQKFNYLPEPVGDSIFAVLVEELGFIGGTILILLYVAFTLRGLILASQIPDKFGGLVIVGLVILVVAQSFTNIASMLGIGPLTGVPLVFVSHGGTALAMALAEIGIILNISRHRKIS